MASKPKEGAPTQIAFLLSQIGGRSAQEFARLLTPLSLAPSDAGILRLLRHSEGISQQSLAQKLNVHASRLVALIDGLETRGLVVREPNATDRRLYSLKLTSKGGEVLRSIGELAREHNKLMCAGLSAGECEQLELLLQKIAEIQGLSPGVHPGYKELGKARSKIPQPTDQTGVGGSHGGRNAERAKME